MNKDLWSLAAARLKEKDRSHVLDLKVDLKDLRAAVEERQRECVEKQWSVNRIGDNKSKVVLRDVFAKIAAWVEKFVEVGDVAVQYDPGHAALPWALVRLLLKVSIQDVQNYAVLAEGLENIAKVVTQYKIVEKLYLRSTSEESTELQSSIVDLYALVLKFLIRAQQFYSKNTIERTFNNVFDFRNKFQGYLDDIAKQQIQVKKYADLVDTHQRKNLEEGLETLTLEEKVNFDRLKKALEDLQRPISRMERQLEDVHDNLKSAQRQEILHWLSPIPYMQHHVQSKRGVLDGTGSWFLNDDRMIQWRSSSSSSIIWLRGIAGSGKSKLISTFIEQQVTEFRDRQNPMPIYFYCARNAAEPERADPAAMFRSLVRQMSSLQKDGVILDPVQDLYEARQRDGFAAGPLTITESTALIIELCQSRQLTTIVIDALDECDPVLRGELFDALTEILQRSNGLVKIVVSSRNERDIICGLTGCLNLEIEAKQNQADINHFVNYEVDHLIRKKRLLYGNVPDDLRQMIKQVLCEKASGMFRWVSLQLQFLQTLKIEVAIRIRLGELPKDLRETYDETYNFRLKSDVEEQSSIAENAFKLLLSLQTPLGQRDFLHALSFCSDDEVDLSAEELLDLCCGFLVLDTELDVFRFAHLSVREYLETKSEYGSESSHALAAQFCLRYLCTSNASGPFLIPRDPWPYDSGILGGTDQSSIDLTSDSRVMSWAIAPSLFEQFREPYGNERYPGYETDQYPFLNRVQEYVCAYWADHTAGSRDLRLVHPLKILLRDFIMDAPQVVSPWFMYWNRLAIHMLNWHRRYSFMPEWASGQNKIADMTHVPADYLFTASLWGFHDLLELRLRSKPDPLLIRSHLMKHNALQLVCWYGISDVAEFLLDWGWSLQVENDFSLLGLAIDGPVELRSFAIDDKHIETVKLLLSRGVDPNEKSKPSLFGPSFFGFSESLFPIFRAVKTGSTELVKHLLDHGANPDVEDKFGRKTFHVAASKGHQEMANLLLAASTDVDDFPRTFCKEVALIHQALQADDEDLLNTALEKWPHGARGNKYLDPALWLATYCQQEACVKALLAKGADVNYRLNGESAIKWIFHWVNGSTPQDRSMVQLLLDHGATLEENCWKYE